jgi:peptide/nickel transport system substrate-binding protein
MTEDRDDIPFVERDGATSPLEWQLTRRAVMVGSAAATAAAIAVGRFGSAEAAGGPAAHAVQRSQEGNTLVYALGFDVDGTLDPQVTNFDSTIRVTLNVCEPLVWMPDATTIVPALAESWEVSPDGLAYTFKLKQGVTFHDGTPFNADAVKYTFDRVVALDKYTAQAVAAGTPADQVAPTDADMVITPGQSHDQIGPYDHSEVIDDYTIKMVLKRPFAPFLTGLNGYLGIVSPTAVQQMGLAEFARKPVGTGPYMVKEWVEADHITLEKNPNYNWGSSFFKNTGPGAFDTIEFKIIPDASVRTGTLQSDETQYVDDVDPLQIEDLKSNPDLEVIEKGQPGSGWVLLFNVDGKLRAGKPQLDAAVRQALSYAIDKDAFNQSVFGGLNTPAASPLMKPTFAYEPKTETIYTYDKAKAEQLLDAAGWVKNGDFREKDGQKLSLYWPIQDRPNDKNMATFVQGSFRDVGVDVVVEAMERAAAREKRGAGDYDISFLWFSFADPDILRAMFHTSNIGGFNFSRYSDPDVDKWLEDGASNQDPEARKAAYSQVQMKVVQDAICIPLADSITHNAKAKRLQGDYLDFLASYVWLNDAKFE